MNPYHDADLELLATEEEIVWVEPPEAHPYVREVIAHCHRRRGNPGRCRVVAYANLKPDVKRDRDIEAFRRRVWHVHDNDPYPGSGHPCEAVDPASIQVGRPSVPSTR